MHIKKYLRKSSISALAAAMVFGSGMFQFAKPVHAANFVGSLSNVVSASVDPDNAYVVHVNFNNEVEGKITFLENGIFRYNVDPSGSFAQYATPNSSAHTTKMQVQPDDSDYYAHPAATIKDTGNTFEISSGDVTISLDKASAKMAVKDSNDQVVMEESAPLNIGNGATIQTLKEDETEYFYGGGTQNGRFSHKGQSINIVKDGLWTDGYSSSPSPFYWSTKGYGVFRNTFKQGVYDFGKTNDETVTTRHNEAEFDAYYFVPSESNVPSKAEAILNDFYKITGNPILLPEYAYYLAHLNCYNRDGWQKSSSNSGVKLEDGNWYTELGKAHDYKIPDGQTMESLNNEAPTIQTQNFGGVINEDTYKYSARAVIDGYQDTDTPLGWFLPNDGYGCGYGQNGYYVKRNSTNPDADLENMYAALDANVNNLKRFVDYADTKGVKVGLWTQSALDPLTSEKDSYYYHGYQNLRDFNKEVNVAGVVALKTDVAWVGQGYSFALNSAKTGYNIVAESGVRPNLVTLDGWAGTQRYGGIWTGDQNGGQWEYIRFHIPTYIGQSLSGNPNNGSDMNGIWGEDPIIQTRDFQWKTFTQFMLDMDGWASEAKKPYYHGDPYTGINRMYLKLKSELMPYLYSEGMQAVDGLPGIRAMFLEFPDDPNTYGDLVKYQYMYGSNFLVAPIYEDAQSDAQGNDIRDGIYLPDEDQIWIDYFTGKQYAGGKTLNNFDAPIWKLPLFVKNGAIVPMYEENNNPEPITETNAKGLDKTKRVVEFWPAGETSYELQEDDGMSLDFENNEDAARDKVDYGSRVSTLFTSDVKDDTATLTANPSVGSYAGYDSNRKTTFVVNVQDKPTAVEAFNGANSLEIVEADSLDEYNALAADDTKTVYFYDEAPNLNKYAQDDESFKDTAITTSPKLYVKFARTDVNANEQKLIIHGFNNSVTLDQEVENTELAAPENLRSIDEEKTPTSITIGWDEVANATSYDVEVDGVLHTAGVDTQGNARMTLLHKDLPYSSTHQYRVRSHNAQGYSVWSDAIEVETLPDPYRNIPPNMTLSLDTKLASGYDITRLTNHDINENWFSNWDTAEEMAKMKTFTFDFKENYKMDRVELYAAGDRGYINKKPAIVTVKRSMDKVHWETLYDQYEVTWDDMFASIDLKGNSMRYLSISVNSPKNTYIALSEIMPHKVDGSISLPVGSNNGQPSFDDASMTQINAYAGTYKGSTTWAQVQDADVNFNDVYDVYDMSYVLFRLDGGTKKTGSVNGNLLMLPDRETVKAGETFQITMQGLDMRNVNAFGGAFVYDQTKYEVVSVNPSAAVSNMVDYTRDQDKGDGTGLLTISYMNRGDQVLINGTQSLGTITMKAKVDGDAYTPNNAMLIGPNFTLEMTDVNTMAGEIPDVPLIETRYYAQDDFNITMTNASHPEDDGTNVQKLTQQQNYNGLFDGTTTYSSDKNNFELKWGTQDETLALPITLHFAFKEPKVMDQAIIYNRSANGSTTSGNGVIKTASALITYEDGSQQSFKFGDASSTASSKGVLKFIMAVDAAHKDQKVKNIDFTMESSYSGNLMFTLGEAQFLYTAKGSVSDIELSNSNPTEMKINDIAPFRATVLPYGITNSYYTVESDRPDVAEVIRIERSGSFAYYLRAKNPGTANLKVTSAGDPNTFVTTTVTVKGDVDTTAIRDAIAKAEKLIGNDKEKEMTYSSWATFKNAYDTAADLLQKPEASQAEFDLATTNLLTAINALQTKVSEADYTLLVDTYREAKALKDQYTEDEFATMKTILGNVENALSKGKADISEKETYELILAMVSEQVKLNQLAGADVLLENLADTIALANAIMATDEVANARPGKVAALQAAIDAGQALVDEASTDRVAIQEAVKAINDAAHELWEVIGKDKLEAAIKSAEEAANGNYEETSLAALQASIKAAKEVAANDDATSDEVENAWHDLIEKMQGLKPAIDTSALELQIEIAEDIMKNEGIYIPSTIEGLEALLSEAQAMVADKTATQEAIKEMTAKLSAANMKARIYADKTALINTLQMAMQLDFSAYTDASVAPLQELLNKAAALIDDELAYQEDVNAMVEEVKAAIDALEVINKDVPNDKPSVDQKPGDDANVQKPNNNGTDTNKNTSVKNTTNTSDETNPAGFGMLMVLAGAALLIMRRKASYRKH